MTRLGVGSTVDLMKTGFLLTLIFVSTFCMKSRAEPAVAHDFINTESAMKVEFLWSKPEGNGPFPVLILIHPHQEWPDKIGAEVFAKNKSLEFWTQKGFITVAVSQPGYGKSQGPADYCGPQSQEAVTTVIKHMRKMPIANKGKIFLYGGSRGAVIASMVATQDPLLAGIILKSGVYDLSTAYKSYAWYNPIKLSIIWEIGFYSETKMNERSASNFVAKIKAPILIIHGSQDDRASLEDAELFAKKVKDAGGSVEFKTIDSEHFIPMAKIQPDMELFMKRYLP